jgi:alanine racemase
MENEKPQGSTRSRRPPRARPTATNLYRIGPPRLCDRTFKTVKAYVSQENLRHNAARIKKIIGPSVALCAVVKANGYGHNARDIVTTLNEPLETSEPNVRGDGASCFAVFTLEEAEQIHPLVATKTILVISPLFAGLDIELIELAQARGFHCTIASATALEYLETTLNPKADKLNVHLKIDSGMGRLGCRPDEAAMLLDTIRKSSRLQLAGVYTHFASADEADATFTEHQQTTFEKFLARNGLKERDDVIKHAANTAAALKFPAARFDMVRCGIGLYGYTNIEGESDPEWDFKPVLRVEAPLIQVKTIPAGQSCGYGRTFYAQRDTTVGIVPMGYADGLFRQLSNRACMRYNEIDLPIVGRVSMDMTILDLSKVPNPHEGMTITILDDKPDSPCNAQALAKLAGTIPYEILTALGNRVKRVLTE